MLSTLKKIVSGKKYAFEVWFPIFRYLKNWREVWTAYKLGASPPAMQLRNGIVVHHRKNDHPNLLFNEIYRDGIYRRFLSGHRSGIVVDIGANIGLTCLDLAKRIPSLPIHCYEPDPHSVKTLGQNITENRLTDRVTIFPEAVGRRRQQMVFKTQFPSWASTLSVYDPKAGQGAAARNDPNYALVEMVSFDEVIERCGGKRLTLLKIDTEGAEADFLEGASKEGLRQVDHIIVEYHPAFAENALARCLQVLDDNDFEHSHQTDRGGVNGMIWAKRRD